MEPKAIGADISSPETENQQSASGDEFDQALTDAAQIAGDRLVSPRPAESQPKLPGWARSLGWVALDVTDADRPAGTYSNPGSLPADKPRRIIWP